MKTTQVMYLTLLMMLGAFQMVDTRPSLVNSVEADNKVEEKVKTSNVPVPPPSTQTSPEDGTHPEANGDLKTSESNRRNKMIDFFSSFLPNSFMSQYQNPYYQPQQQFYDQSEDFEEEDIMARGNRRKPGNRENSPIFYVRLPPTPYMYVPGMGYISQPPTIRPLAFAPPPLPQPVANPFINVPVNFLSNGKPTNVYEWPLPSPVNLGQPQYPSYLPSRPANQRPPSYRPHKHSFLPDSKITHLKGPYVFNGRPEDIYVLPQNAHQPHPQEAHFGINSYQQTYSSPHDFQSQHHQAQLPTHLPPQHQDYTSHSSQTHRNYPSHHQQHAAAYQQAQFQQFGGYNPAAFNGGYNSMYSDSLSNYY